MKYRSIPGEMDSNLVSTLTKCAPVNKLLDLGSYTHCVVLQSYVF